MNAPDMLGGRCLNLTWGAFTRDDLLRSGLSPAAADEVMRFGERLAAKARRSPPLGAQPETRSETAMCDCSDVRRDRMNEQQSRAFDAYCTANDICGPGAGVVEPSIIAHVMRGEHFDDCPARRA